MQTLYRGGAFTAEAQLQVKAAVNDAYTGVLGDSQEDPWFASVSATRATVPKAAQPTPPGRSGVLALPAAVLALPAARPAGPPPRAADSPPPSAKRANTAAGPDATLSSQMQG